MLQFDMLEERALRTVIASALAYWAFEVTSDFASVPSVAFLFTFLIFLSPIKSTFSCYNLSLSSSF